jgi:hypothetical protein
VAGLGLAGRLVSVPFVEHDESLCRAELCSRALPRICLLGVRAGTGLAHWEWLDQKLARPDTAVAWLITGAPPSDSHPGRCPAGHHLEEAMSR